MRPFCRFVARSSSLQVCVALSYSNDTITGYRNGVKFVTTKKSLQVLLCWHWSRFGYFDRIGQPTSSLMRFA